MGGACGQAPVAAVRGPELVTRAVISTDSITTGSTGRSPAPVGVVAIASTTSRLSWSATSPKIVCLSVQVRGRPTVMKNCEPLVPGPALAIASR